MYNDKLLVTHWSFILGSNKGKYVHGAMVYRLVKLAQEKVW